MTRPFNPSLTRNPPYSRMKLKELPITRDENHKYTWTPTGEVLDFSTTEVCGHKKSPETRANIERTRPDWEPRGKGAHLCLDEFLNGKPITANEKYSDWIVPLIEHEFWIDFEPWATEYMVCDLKKSVGGQLDVLGYDHKNKRSVLLDLKTQSQRNSSIYNTDAQLGSYSHALIDHHRLMVDVCLTRWARPWRCVLGKDQDVDRCGLAWLEVWESFKVQRELKGEKNDE